MYLQAQGWRVAKKDRIDLTCARLKDAQGLYTCPPSSVGHKPFHCSLQVREDAHVMHQVLLIALPASSSTVCWMQKVLEFGESISKGLTGTGPS